MDELTTDLPAQRIRIDLAGPVAEALWRRAVREDRSMPVEAARIVRLTLEREGDLESRPEAQEAAP